VRRRPREWLVSAQGTVAGIVTTAEHQSLGVSQNHRNGAGAGDWSAVRTVVRQRMRELGMSTAALARETGLSETTIRYLGQSSDDKRHRRSTLVVVSAVLRWRYDHLANILHGELNRDTTCTSRTSRLGDC
jgi:hypothetical protein